MFGRNMAVVLTKANGFYYINLYNNNPRNPGRCSLGWDEFLKLTNMMWRFWSLKEKENFCNDSKYLRVIGWLYKCDNK
jgi:hypothetical protein